MRKHATISRHASNHEAPLFLADLFKEVNRYDVFCRRRFFTGPGEIFPGLLNQPVTEISVRVGLDHEGTSRAEEEQATLGRPPAGEKQTTL